MRALAAVFPYLDDVAANDGGIFVLPGSHKSTLVRPVSLFGSLGIQGSRVAGRNFGSNATEARDAAWEDTPEARAKIPGKRPAAGQIPEGCIKPTFTAGDILILPEATLHGVVPWRAKGRTRRALMLRHCLHYLEGSVDCGRELEGTIHPLTMELMASAPARTVKKVAKMSAREIAAAFNDSTEPSQRSGHAARL